MAALIPHSAGRGLRGLRPFSTSPAASCWLCQWGALASPRSEGQELLKYLVFQLSPGGPLGLAGRLCPQVRAPTRGSFLAARAVPGSGNHFFPHLLPDAGWQ